MLEPSAVVSANGFIPCFSKWPPKGFNATCAKVEVGKYKPSFIGPLLAWALTADLDRTFCFTANCSPLGEIKNWPIRDKSSPTLLSVFALKRKSVPPVSPGVLFTESVTKGSLLLPPPTRSRPYLSDLRSVVKSKRAIFYLSR